MFNIMGWNLSGQHRGRLPAQGLLIKILKNIIIILKNYRFDLRNKIIINNNISNLKLLSLI